MLPYLPLIFGKLETNEPHTSNSTYDVKRRVQCSH